MPRLLFWVALLCMSRVAVPAAELARQIILAPHIGDGLEDREIRRWQERLTRRGMNGEDLEQLGWSFVAKARTSLDAGYYKLAEMAADVMAEDFGPLPAVRLLRGHALHHLHRFVEAEVEARELVAQRGAPGDFGLLSDVLMERGEVDAAAAALQRMVNLRPGAEAYCRISHLRWLSGDDVGALEAMEAAWRATWPRSSERGAWMSTRLATLLLLRGDLTRARVLAAAAQRQVEGFAPALFVQARIELAENEVAEGLRCLRRVVEQQPLPEYQWWLADVLHMSREETEAKRVEERIKSRGESIDPRTLSLFLATRRDNTDAAVSLARGEMRERLDVFTRDAFAWALFARGEVKEAAEEIGRAIATGTKDPRVLFHAGEIALARGHRGEAVDFFARAAVGRAALTPGERARLAAAAMESQPPDACGAARTSIFPP